MQKKVVKLGVVGLKRGRGIAADIIGEDNVVIRAISDKDPDTLESARKFFEEEKKIENLLCFDSLEELLTSDVDAVLIATDAPLHTKHAIMAMEAGKHVISEIPVSFTLEEARELKACVKAHPELKYMTGENCNFWPHLQSWKKMRENGMFGEIVYAEGEYLHAKDPHTFDPANHPDSHWRTHLDAIRYLTHELGPLLDIMDDRCVSVSCMEPTAIYNPYKKGAQNGIALFRTAKGAVIRVFICFGAYVGGSEHNYALYGTRGSINTGTKTDYTHGYSYAKLSAIPGSLYKKVEIPSSPIYDGEPVSTSGHGGADGKMMSAFIKCIIEDTVPPIDVDAGIRMSIPGIIAHESALQGGALLEIPDIE